MALIFFCVEITYIIITKTAKTRTTFYVVIKSVTSYLFQLKRTYTNITVFKCMHVLLLRHRHTVCPVVHSGNAIKQGGGGSNGAG